MGYPSSLLTDNERIKVAVRQHIFGLIKQIWVPLLLALLIIVATIIGSSLQPAPNYFGWLLVLLIIPAAMIFLAYLQWSNHLYVVTNYRVISIRGVVNKSTFDTAIEKINDIATSQSFWGRLFHYGTVELLSGTDLGENKLENIDDPIGFKKQLLEAKAQAMGEPVTDHISQRSNNPAQRAVQYEPAPPAIAPSNNSPLAKALQELEDLRRQKLITEQEYQQKRSQILSRIGQ